MTYDDVLSRFPKARPMLPDEYFKIWDEHYLDSRKGRTKATRAASFMEKWLHKKVAWTSKKSLKTLEIGAGTLNQLEFENPDVYDIVEPQHILYEDSDLKDRVRYSFDDIMMICDDQKYDRIISVATFEHICNLPEVVEKCVKLLNDEGVLSVSIPNEGRFLWHFAYTVTTGREFKKKYGLDYEQWMRYEHVNSADEIEVVLKHFFKDVKIKHCGLGRSLSVYRYLECRGKMQYE